MGILTQYFIALLVTGIINGSLGIFVILKGYNKRLNQVLALYSLSLFLWSIFEALGITRYNESLALLLWRVNHIGVIFIPVFLVHFVFLLLNIKGRKRKLIPISYVVACIFLILDTTPLLISAVVPKFSFRYFINPGHLYYVFFWLWISWAAYGIFELFKEYFKTSGYRRNQMQYFCWSLLFSYLGGVPNFFPTFNIEIPILMPFGTYAIPLYTFATAYAIFRYRFMDIKTALTRVGIFVIVYLLVLGIPLGLTGWGKYWIEGLFGQNWYWLPMFIFLILATAGPFIYIFLQHRAEDALFKERRRYQETINNLSESMINIRNIEKLFTTITLTVTDAIKIKFAAIYLKMQEYKSFQLKNCYPVEEKSRFQEFIPLNDPLIGIFEQRKKPLLGEEIGHQEKINLDSNVVVPCLGKDGLLGFIVLGAKQNNQMYTNDDLLVLESLSYDTSFAIENCIHLKELEDKHRQERAYEMDFFSYSLAHEIDNPMSAMKTGIEWIRRYFVNEFNPTPEQRAEVERYCGYLLEMQQRVSTMVRAIEEFGAKTEGALDPLKIEDVITGFTDFYLPNFKHHGIYFSKELPSQKIPFIRGVKQELEEIMIILANNSIYALQEMKVRQEGFSQPKVSIRIDLLNPGWIRITFSDNGEGIRKEDLKLIFNAFVTTKPSSVGTGMGLYNALRIVEKHKGRIWAESEGKDKGVSFIIELPVAKDVKEEDFKKEGQRRRLF